VLEDGQVVVDGAPASHGPESSCGGYDWV
jgi:hypothetical protein